MKNSKMAHYLQAGLKDNMCVWLNHRVHITSLTIYLLFKAHPTLFQLFDAC